MTKARDLASLLSGSGSGTIAPALVSDQSNTSTGAFDVPAGTTAQRPISPNTGYLRYNTDEDSLEQYNGQWVTLTSPPVISSVTPLDTNGDSGTVVTINGSNFTDTTQVKFITQGGAGTEYTAGTVSFVSSIQITATFPTDFTIADEPLDVKVIDTVGDNTLEDAITLGGVPAWSTSAGSLGSGAEGDSFSASVVAVDPEGGDVDYSVSSGALPTGLSFTDETGAISGSFTNAQHQSSTSSFSVVPSDSVGNTGTSRTFSITQNGDGDTSFPYVTTRLAANGTDGRDNDVATADDVAGLSGSVGSLPAVGQYGPYVKPDGYWGVAMDGSYDRLQVSSQAASGLGTSNFTYEFWMKETGDHYSSQARYFIQGVSGTTRIELATDASNNNLRVNTNGTDHINVSWTPERNVWYHIAVVRTSTSTNGLKLYVDGSLLAQGTCSNSIVQDQLLVGGLDWAANYALSGYISNFRVSNTARYTENFTPSTTPLQSDANTIFLLAQSNRFVDNSSNDFTVDATAAGQATVVPISPFVSPSKIDRTESGGVFFDGGDDYIQYANNAAFQVSGDYALTFWAFVPHDVILQSYWTAILSLGGTGYDQSAMAVYCNNSNCALAVDIDQQGGGLRVDPTGNDQDMRGQWNYIEVTRSSGTVYVFRNGKLIGSGASSVNFTGNNSWGLLVGLSKFSENNYFRGHIADIKFAKQAGHTSAYSVPTDPPTNTANTSFLKRFTDAGIVDDAGCTNWSTYGSTQIDTSDKKFGTGSFFVNTTDGSSTSSGNLNCQDWKYTRQFDLCGDWTIEYWFKGPSGNSGTDGGPFRRVIDLGGGNSEGALQILVDTSSASYSSAGGAHFLWDGGNDIPSNHSGAGQPDVCDNNWHHLAFTFDSSAGTLREYTDGTLYATRSITAGTVFRPSGQSTAPTIGASSTDWGQGRLVGRIDDFRITNGIARYTGSSYTVPTKEQPIW